MQGHVPEDALRRALTASFEMGRWDTVALGAKDRDGLQNAFKELTNLLNTLPPGRPVEDSLTSTNAFGEWRMVCEA